MSGRRFFLPAFTLTAIALFTCAPLEAQEKKKKGEFKNKIIGVEALAEKAKSSIVVILHTGRQGKQAGLGTGFVVDADGLIATNFHVIGEGRPITVQFPDGTKHEATEVHASDRHLDLAVVRINAKGLTAIPLGNSETIKNGQAIAALGHPQGLKNSVVAGVLSGRREIEGLSMLQIAMPIEQGNSGGPVLDLDGKAVGVVTMKSLVTANLGFAVPIKDLQMLLKRPNTVAMSRWVTLGKLDSSEWQTQYGGNWHQRAGRIIVDGAGAGFGGRSLCFFKRETPKDFPYEIAVTVKLDNERGAAGLFFGGESKDKHYGFYPSGGNLRFVRFEGPAVDSWKILHNAFSEHYRPGEWNTLKVRVDKNRAVCFVNDREVIDEKGIELFGSAAGLAKFRDTVAEFKKFQLADKIDAPSVTPAIIAEMREEVEAWKLAPASKLPAESKLLKAPTDGIRMLRDRAAFLETQATQLRKLAQMVHQGRVLDDLAKLTEKAEADIDLLRCALLIAKLDNEDLETETYAREVDRLAREIGASVPKDADEDKKLEAMNRALFKERGFHGSRHDFYARNNSYLNEVIDDREGLPITLSVLYLEIARRLDLKVVGVALPGHFVVRHEPKDLPSYIIDVFEGGTTMTDKQAMEKIVRETGSLPKRKDFLAAGKKLILKRMLHNLLSIAAAEKDRNGMLRYLDAILTIDANAHAERYARAEMRAQVGLSEDALRDCDYLLDNANENEIDVDAINNLKRRLQK
jgi:serine protease Do